MAGAGKRKSRQPKITRKGKPAAPATVDTAPEGQVPLVSDPRFASQHWDPRFGRVPVKASSTTAAPDERFTHALSQPGFQSSSARVDRFGRARPGRRRRTDASESDDSDDDESDEGAAVGLSASSGSDDSASDEGDVEQLSADEAAEAAQAAIPRGASTRRLAVIGLDWSSTRAVDIFAGLASFCPSAHALRRVAVHPSKLGLRRLAAEARLGPAVVSRVDQHMLERARVTVDDNDASGADESSGSDSDDGPDVPGARDVERERWRLQRRLRKYESERLQYFYAVAEFESAAAADAAYDQCDGVEYAQSRRAFDLRFIPDEMKIETAPREVCNTMPDGYRPPNIAPSTLSNSTVKLSWDADAPERVVLKKRTVGKHQLDEENLKAYLASASEEEDETEVARKRALLLGGGDGGDADAEEEEEDAGMELEVSFEPGMLEKGAEIVRAREEKLKRDAETPWEARMRRMSERKAEKRRLQKERAQGDGGEEHGEEDAEGEATFDDPFFSEGPSFEKGQRNAKKRKRAVPEEHDEEAVAEKERKAQELELLLADDGAARGGMRDALAQAESDDDDDRLERRKQKRTRGRRRSEKEKRLEAKIVKPSVLDTADERFQGLFSSHHFAIDPTHPKFKENETTQRILNEKQKRFRDGDAADVAPKSKPANGTSDAVQNKNEASGVMDLAAKIKAKAKAKSGSKRR